MSKFLMCVILVLESVLGGYNKVELKELFQSANEIVVYENGVDRTISRDDVSFEKIMTAIKAMNESSHEMPAFGVALNDDTKRAMKEGLWVEFVYMGIMEHNQMPFDRLLINVEKDYSGYNVFRCQNGVYEGRCFYISLDGDMSSLYDCLQKI